MKTIPAGVVDIVCRHFGKSSSSPSPAEAVRERMERFIAMSETHRDADLVSWARSILPSTERGST
jgi:hypothetical protein